MCKFVVLWNADLRMNSLLALLQLGVGILRSFYCYYGMLVMLIILVIMLLETSYYAHTMLVDRVHGLPQPDS